MKLVAKKSLPVIGEQSRDIGVQTALILAHVDGEEIRVLNATKDGLELESPDPLPEGLSLRLSVFNLAQWKYDEHVVHAEVLQRRQLPHSEICKVRIDNPRASYAECISQLHSVWQTGHHRDGSPPRAVSSKPAYTAQRSFRSHDNFAEQRRAWFAPKPIDSDQARFSKLLDNAEVSFSICTPDGYQRALKNGCSSAFRQALEEVDLTSHGLFTATPTRVYVGNEFCNHLFPHIEQLFAILKNAQKEGLRQTVITPLLMEHTIEATELLLHRLEAFSREHDSPVELVVNDWGMLDMLKRCAPSLEPTLGKLLNKRKKDPRAEWYWGHERHEKDLERNSLNSPWYRRFLAELGIERFEFEPGPLRGSIPGPGHTLHFPYYYTNSSVFCMLYAEVTEFYAGRQRLVRSCPRYCTDFCYLYPDHLKLVGKGNTLFGFDDQVLVDPRSLENYVAQGIDRLVFTPDC